MSTEVMSNVAAPEFEMISEELQLHKDKPVTEEISGSNIKNVGWKCSLCISPLEKPSWT